MTCDESDIADPVSPRAAAKYPPWLHAMGVHGVGFDPGGWHGVMGGEVGGGRPAERLLRGRKPFASHFNLHPSSMHRPVEKV